MNTQIRYSWLHIWLIISSLFCVVSLLIWWSSQSVRNPIQELFIGAGRVVNDNIRLNKVLSARTPEETARGLMYRRIPLAKDEGMVFDYGKEVKSEEHIFWMRNTFIPLGILFTDNNLQIVDVIPYMKPFDETPRQSKTLTWRYAIEVAPVIARQARLGTYVIPPRTSI